MNENEYEPVIGLEIHIQLKTKYKMFCECTNEPFESEPNTNVCPVCLGLPGAMPVANNEAIGLAQRFANGVGSKLQKTIVFERKNYFYPDLPKGFQITCPHYPVSVGGGIDMSYWRAGLKIRFREIHLEEDTAKSMHKNGKTWLDFNKSGVPLLEIVTEPDFNNIDLTIEFSKEIQRVARYLGVSEGDMQKGQMRLEANISTRKKGNKSLPGYRVELKNINSFNFMKKALNYELRRQVAELERNKILYQETRGYDEIEKQTFVQRSKEDPNDYRYFPEPDILQIKFDDKYLDNITTSKTRLPSDVRISLLNKKLPKQYIDILVTKTVLYDKFNKLLDLGYEPSRASNVVINELRYKKLSAEEIHTYEQKSLKSKLLNEDELTNIAKKIINKYPNPVSDYQKGNENSLQFLIGRMMMETNGKADPRATRRILLMLLKILK